MSRMDTTRARASTTPGEQEPSPAEALRCLQQHLKAWQASVSLVCMPHLMIDSFGLFARPLALWAALRALLVLLSCLLSE